MIVGIYFNYIVKTIGTAFLGSFMTVFGISFYAGHLILHEGEKQSPAVWGYLGGMIGLWIIGSIVQWKLFKDLPDGFKEEEEAFEGSNTQLISA